MIWDFDDTPLPSISQHEKDLRDVRCMISQELRITLHHARGGSMATCPFGSPGAGEKQLDALQIPLHYTWHTGGHGIDTQVNGGVLSWEARWGSQVALLNCLCLILGYSVWNLALKEAKERGRYITVRRVENFLLEQPCLFLPRQTTSTPPRS